MRYQIELTHSNPVPTAVVRSRVPAKELAQFVPAACGEVWSFIRSAGLPRPGRHMALYLDAQGAVEVGAEVSEPFAGNERVHCSQLPAGRAVTTVHFGPYAGDSNQTPLVSPVLNEAKPDNSTNSTATTAFRQAIDILVSPQTSFQQRQAAWKQLRDAGELDQALATLKQGATSNPASAEYPM